MNGLPTHPRPACKAWHSCAPRAGPHLPASVGASRVLCGEEHEVRVRPDHFAQLWDVQLSVVIQQPAVQAGRQLSGQLLRWGAVHMTRLAGRQPLPNAVLLCKRGAEAQAGAR